MSGRMVSVEALCARLNEYPIPTKIGVTAIMRLIDEVAGIPAIERLYTMAEMEQYGKAYADARDKRLAAPTQGADARPVAIYQVYWGETASWTDTTPETFALVDPKYRRVVYATRDAAPSGNWPFAEIRNILQTLTLLCEESGEPCDGFRFRELILQARKVLAAIAPRDKT